jgi:hypothetical protein
MKKIRNISIKITDDQDKRIAKCMAYTGEDNLSEFLREAITCYCVTLEMSRENRRGKK